MNRTHDWNLIEDLASRLRVPSRGTIDRAGVRVRYQADTGMALPEGSLHYILSQLRKARGKDGGKQQFGPEAQV